MCDKAEKKNEIKKQLRALLLSAPAALTVTELKRDYYEFNGLAIPYRELGYTMLEDLFKDMQDAFIISWKNGIMCLQAVAQEASVHIQKLVSKQKVSNKNKWATLRKGGPTGPGPRSRSSHHRGRGPPQYNRPRPSVPAFIRKQITQLLRAYPGGLPLTHIDTAFSRRFGVQLDFHRLGFNSTKELLESLPDNVQLQNLKNGECRVLPPLHEQISHYIKPNNQNETSHYEKHRTDYNWRERPSDTKVTENPVGFVAPSVYSAAKSTETGNKTYQTQLSVGSSNEYTDTRAVPRGRGRRRTGDRSDGNVSVGRDSISSTGSLELCTGDDSGISEGVQNKIRMILEEHPDGVWSNSLPIHYMKKYGTELHFKDYGYVSIIEMCGALHNLITIERPEPKGDWLLFDARFERPKSESPQPIEDKSKKPNYSAHTYPDPLLKEKIRQVLQRRPKGILLTELPDIYKKFTGEDIPWKETGYQNFQLFLISLADSVLNLEYKGNGQMLVFAIDNGESPKDDLLKPESVISDIMRSSVKLPDIPGDAVGARVFYRSQPLPPLNTHITINVSNIDSPGVFWIQLRGKTTHKALDKCMNELERIYCSAEGDAYRIPDYLMVLGQVVAAVFPEDSNWHRCVITALTVGKYVEVYFVDFGNTCEVHRDNIRLLKSSLLKLPAQAIQARLANIEPFDSKKWTLNARNRLLELVMNRALYTYVTFEKDRVLSLLLVDTSTSVDICFNDLLVNEGYAKFKPDTVDTDYGLCSRQVLSYTHGEAFAAPQTVQSQPPASQQEPAVPCTPVRRYVQPIQLTSEHIVNLINWQDTAYLPSAEVSSFFFEEDVITCLLQSCKGEAERVKLNLKEHPELYEDLKQCDIIKDDEIKTITLYKLSSVPVILEMFKHESEELHSNVVELIQMFDPNDPYWRGEDYPDSECSHNSTELAESSLDLDEIELNLRLFQFKRKRILKSMFTNPENHAQDVEEITEVENQISQLKQLQDIALSRKVVKNTALEPDSPVKSPESVPSSPLLGMSVPPLVPRKSGEGAAHHSSSTSTPIKMNIVAPMQNQAVTSKPTAASSSNTQPHTTTAKELANQELLLQRVAQVQQQFLQTMLLQPMPGQFPGQVLPIPGTNQTMSLQPNQLMPVPGTNQTVPLTSQLPVNQTMPGFIPPNSMNPSQLGLNQQAGAQNTQLMSMMQTGATLPTNMQYLGGINPYAGIGSSVGIRPNSGTSQVRLQQPCPTGQQPAAMASNMPLLPGLLPLLNSLNMNQDSGAKTDKK